LDGFEYSINSFYENLINARRWKYEFTTIFCK
jgi:hypothetical protein